ncbi:MAG: photosynthetic reaction center cytochrome PufC [Paracoccaceae bacterium]
MSEFQQNRKGKFVTTVRDIILGGLAPGAVFGSLALIYIFWPLHNVKEQVGFRGVGMVQFKPAEDVAVLEELNVVPENQAGPPIEPLEDEELAGDVYENVKVLGDLTVANFTRLMVAMTAWVSPEQGCNYCHAGADEGNYAGEELYTKHVARRMIQMTQHTNENWQTHVGMTGVTCYTCHRGQNVPQYHFYEEPRPAGSAMLGDNTMLQNRSDATAGYSSLPGDPLTAFLLEQYPIRVADSVPRITAFGASLQDTEWTYSLMFHFSQSLGVNCTYCHNSRAWGEWDQSPPQRITAWYAVRMIRDLNQNYMHNLEWYPDDRLGPLGDAPKANCTTCHQGVAKPLYGVSMLDDWPELRTTGKPVYGTPDATSEADTSERAEAGTQAAN